MKTQTAEELVKELRERGSVGLDMSPGDELCSTAARAIEALAAECEARRDIQDKRTDTNGATWHYIYLERKVDAIDSARKATDSLGLLKGP